MARVLIRNKVKDGNGKLVDRWYCLDLRTQKPEEGEGDVVAQGKVSAAMTVDMNSGQPKMFRHALHGGLVEAPFQTAPGEVPAALQMPTLARGEQAPVLETGKRMLHHMDAWTGY